MPLISSRARRPSMCSPSARFASLDNSSPSQSLFDGPLIRKLRLPLLNPRSLRVAAEDEGEAGKIRAVKEAEAEASRTEIQAKADAEAKFLGGQVAPSPSFPRA